MAQSKLTLGASIKLYPHGYVTVPDLRLDAYVLRCDWWIDGLCCLGITVTTTLEFLDNEQ